MDWLSLSDVEARVNALESLMVEKGLAEHEAPPAATLHCLTGDVTLRSGDQEWPLRAGQLVPIPSARHSVEAHSDAVLLLTVSLA